MDNKENVWYTPTAWSPDGKSIVVIVAKIDDHTDQLARVAVSDGSIPVRGMAFQGRGLKPSQLLARWLVHRILRASGQSE